MLVILLILADGVDPLGSLTYQAGSPWNNILCLTSNRTLAVSGSW